MFQRADKLIISLSLTFLQPHLSHHLEVFPLICVPQHEPVFGAPTVNGFAKKFESFKMQS